MPPRGTGRNNPIPEHKTGKFEGGPQTRKTERSDQKTNENNARKQDLRRLKKNAKRREAHQQSADNATQMSEGSTSFEVVSLRHQNISEPVAAQDQAANSALMRLPAELRMLMYEEVMQNHNPTGHDFGSQLLVTCKQVHREARKILGDKFRDLVLLRLTEHGVQVDQEATSRDLRITDAEISANKWIATVGQRSSVLVYIHQNCDGPACEGRLPRSWTINQQLYLLVTALSVTKVVHLHVRVRSCEHAPPSKHYDRALWPLNKVNSSLRLTFEGVPRETVLLIQTYRSFMTPSRTGFRDWLDAHIAIRQLNELLDLAGISTLGLRFLSRSFAATQPQFGAGFMRCYGIDEQSRRTASIVHSTLQQQKWVDLRRQALEKLQQASSEVVG